MSNSTFPLLFISPTLYILVPNILALRVIQRETPQKLGTSWDAWVEPLASASETSPSSLGWNPQLLIQSSPNSTKKTATSQWTLWELWLFGRLDFSITGQIIFCLGVGISAYIIERYLNTLLVFKSVKAPLHRLLVLDSHTAFASQFRRGHGSWFGGHA